MKFFLTFNVASSRAGTPAWNVTWKAGSGFRQRAVLAEKLLIATPLVSVLDRGALQGDAHAYWIGDVGSTLYLTDEILPLEQVF